MNFNKRCISKEEFKKYEDSDVAYALYVRDNLKPNDYFRTFDGQIFKSINVSPIEGNEIYYANGDYTWADISTVANFSDNLIDLVEVLDYVNGKEVTEIMKDEEGNVTDVLFTEEVESQSYSLLPIKNIVTKEYFTSGKYEVEQWIR